ncbi:MAG: succinate--CoA ligase subunit beta [Kastovskya adunca ATA6-11-RM4]|jgi:succinyl-CoA synthetase beta subunit|nr:succinate--CoA ligase subunit beta [Kastovskya adunca ATA6-11-RM4]
MDLLEYQAKELFREIGIPILPSQRIDQPRDLKGLQIPYPVVLKSQVRTGGRGKAGGIKFVENTIDAIAAARTIFNLSILGEYPQVLLAETRYDADREFYLAVVLDYSSGRPVLLGSPQGGINVEAVMEQMQKVVVEQEFSPFYARRLALKMGLQGALIDSISNVVQKMYQLFVQKDLDLVEINPLGISVTGEVMALDGKVSANDNALSRHPELESLAPLRINGQAQEQQFSNQFKGLEWISGEGNIGIICNGTGLAAATLDLIYQAKGNPASCLIIDSDTGYDALGVTSIIEQLEVALDQIANSRDIKVILVNILSSAVTVNAVVEAIASYLLPQVEEIVGDRAERTTGVSLRSRRDRPTNSAAGNPQITANAEYSASSGKRRSTTRSPNFVIRVVGSDIDGVKERLAALPVHWLNNLDEAVARAVSLAKSATKKS